MQQTSSHLSRDERNRRCFKIWRGEAEERSNEGEDFDFICIDYLKRFKDDFCVEQKLHVNGRVGFSRHANPTEALNGNKGFCSMI